MLVEEVILMCKVCSKHIDDVFGGNLRAVASKAWFMVLVT